MWIAYILVSIIPVSMVSSIDCPIDFPPDVHVGNSVILLYNFCIPFKGDPLCYGNFILSSSLTATKNTAFQGLHSGTDARGAEC